MKVYFVTFCILFLFLIPIVGFLSFHAWMDTVPVVLGRSHFSVPLFRLLHLYIYLSLHFLFYVIHHKNLFWFVVIYFKNVLKFCYECFFLNVCFSAFIQPACRLNMYHFCPVFFVLRFSTLRLTRSLHTTRVFACLLLRIVCSLYELLNQFLLPRQHLVQCF